MPNKGEFVGYYIIFQLGNGGEVTKYLQQVHEEVLKNPEVQFAIKVWSALKYDHYAAFFRLLREANFLQACLMHRYVGPVRLTAIKKMVRSFPQGRKESYFPVRDFANILMFEDEEDALEFLDHCGLEVSMR
jgi:hypothetical protein